MPHALAASALLGTGGQAAFSDATLRDPAIANLRRKVRLEPIPKLEPWPKDRPARVTWHFADGETWTAHCESARGGADQPIDREMLLAKLEETTGATFPHMARMLQSIVACERKSLTTSWRGAVAQMIDGGS
jgi:2-methylcitrate dehydratase PrpD